MAKKRELKARIEQLEAENKALREKLALATILQPQPYPMTSETWPSSTPRGLLEWSYIPSRTFSDTWPGARKVTELVVSELERNARCAKV